MKINEARDKSNVDLKCYISSIIEKETKNKKPYVAVTFSDETGDITANVWDMTKGAYEYKENDVVLACGTVSSFNEKLQFNVRNLSRLDLPLTAFFKRTENSVEQMFNRLIEQVSVIKDPLIRFLSEELLLTDPFKKMYCEAPAAKEVHHNWIGGLLEHSLSLCNMARLLYDNQYRTYFPTLNMDKVLFGCLFHDWGKILEYSYDTPSIGYTKRGCLQHHMGIVAEAVTRKMVEWEKEFLVPENKGNTKFNGYNLSTGRELFQELLHIIYSHHGNPEWGSMVRPATAEALYVHLIDYIDGNMMHMRDIIKDHKEDKVPGMSKKSWVHQSQYLFLPKEVSF